MTSRSFTGNCILVTGATGSFGRLIIRHLLDHSPAEIRLLSRDEKKQWDMRREFRDHPSLTFILGDVRDADSVDAAMRGVGIVFHAAALKQVPNCEENIEEAIRTNTLGAINVIKAALNHAVQCVVAISTDKAVKPVNVMGMTKALQERLFVNANASPANRGTCFACARYGNVIGSRGSVIPLFKSQIQAGGPVTITHPEMTRFLITLPEAIDLVFKAAREARGGEIFVPKVPSARVSELAEVMVESLAGDSQIKIDCVGIRPGEKMHEVLISEEESWRSLANEEYFLVLPMEKWPSLKSAYPDYQKLPHLEYTSNSGTTLDKAALKRLLVQETWCVPLPGIHYANDQAADTGSYRNAGTSTPGSRAPRSAF